MPNKHMLKTHLHYQFSWFPNTEVYTVQFHQRSWHPRQSMILNCQKLFQELQIEVSISHQLTLVPFCFLLRGLSHTAYMYDKEEHGSTRSHQVLDCWSAEWTQWNPASSMGDNLMKWFTIQLVTVAINNWKWFCKIYSEKNRKKWKKTLSFFFSKNYNWSFNFLSINS